MAENRAAFILRRRRSLGFSKCRWLRTSFSVPSRSSFFFNRRSALSTDSPFFSLISVKRFSLLSLYSVNGRTHIWSRPNRIFQANELNFTASGCQRAKRMKSVSFLARFDGCNHRQVEQLVVAIGQPHQKHPSAGLNGDVFTVRNLDLPPICQVNRERP